MATSGDANLHFVDGLALGVDSTNASASLADGIHLNDAGAAIIAGKLAAILTLPAAGR